MKILAVDPGGTTGIARYDSAVNHKLGATTGFDSSEYPTLDALDVVHLALQHSPMDLLVCEAFFISGATLKKTRQPDALESIGALRYLAHWYNVPFELQTPAERKFATNARLKQLGWRNPTPGGHCDDAARHLLVAAVRRGVIDPAIFLKEEE